MPSPGCPMNLWRKSLTRPLGPYTAGTGQSSVFEDQESIITGKAVNAVPHNIGLCDGQQKDWRLSCSLCSC